MADWQHYFVGSHLVIFGQLEIRLNRCFFHSGSRIRSLFLDGKRRVEKAFNVFPPAVRRGGYYQRTLANI